MSKIRFKNRDVYIYVTGTPEEPFIEEAYYEDGDLEDLNEAEIAEIYESHAKEVYEAAFDNCLRKAEVH